VHTVCSAHRRSSAKSRKLPLILTVLSGVLVGATVTSTAANADPADPVPPADPATLAVTPDSTHGNAAQPVTPALANGTPTTVTPTTVTPVAAKPATVTSAAATLKSGWAVVGPNRNIYTGQTAFLSARTGAGALRTAGMRVALHVRTARGWYAGWIRRADQLGRAGFVVRPGGTAQYRVALVGTGPIAAGLSSPVTVAVSRGESAIIAEAARHRGAPYRYGAAGPRAFDCSGFTQYVFRRFGRSLPHSATAQARLGTAVAKSAARPGDLVLFGGRGFYYHAAIYAGQGYMWDASTEGQPVARRKIYSQAFVVRRVI
jgi:cell wall-associated NlpC family hydrolase